MPIKTLDRLLLDQAAQPNLEGFHRFAVEF
jgi:hypothetical protein